MSAGGSGVLNWPAFAAATWRAWGRVSGEAIPMRRAPGQLAPHVATQGCSTSCGHSGSAVAACRPASTATESAWRPGPPPAAAYPEHFSATGANAIALYDVANCWVKDVSAACLMGAVWRTLRLGGGLVPARATAGGVPHRHSGP